MHATTLGEPGAPSVILLSTRPKSREQTDTDERRGREAWSGDVSLQDVADHVGRFHCEQRGRTVFACVDRDVRAVSDQTYCRPLMEAALRIVNVRCTPRHDNATTDRALLDTVQQMIHRGDIGRHFP